MSVDMEEIYRELGTLSAKVKNLESAVESQGKKIDELLAVVNQGRGGIWVGMAIASAVGGLVTWLAAHLTFGAPK